MQLFGAPVGDNQLETLIHSRVGLVKPGNNATQGVARKANTLQVLRGSALIFRGNQRRLWELSK